MHAGTVPSIELFHGTDIRNLNWLVISRFYSTGTRRRRIPAPPGIV
jgi:hypothetical protein